MDWTSLYLKTKNLNVFVLGSGEVATRRAKRFLSHGANVRLAGSHLEDSIKEAKLYSTDDVDNLVQWADLVVIAGSNQKLNDYVADISGDKLLNRADCPDDGNIIVPTSFNIGDVEISIFTNGKSPLMARQLRKKIQAIITEDDIREIQLQDYARDLLKNKIKGQKQRKEILYKIFDDENISKLELSEAKEYIGELIDSEFKG